MEFTVSRHAGRMTSRDSLLDYRGVNGSGIQEFY